MELLSSWDQIDGALSAMNPLARQACLVFGTEVGHDPSMLNQPDRLMQRCGEVVLLALEGSGYDRADPLPIQLFVEAHGDAIYGVGVSLATLVAKAIERNK